MATRSKRFLTGMISGYGSIATNILFTMTSVPLALHYLEKERFGLWALALQINGYLNLIDLGMSGAVSRFIADYKDDVNGGEYGSHLLTGGLVFLIQGFLMALAGAAFSWFAPAVFAVPTHLASEFRILLLILTSTTGLSVILRSVGSPLWAFQRNDVIYGCASLGLLLTLAILWLGFHAGWGVMSFAIAQVPVVVGTMVVYAWIGIRNHYFPKRGHWGKPDLAVFRNIFHFGKDILMVTMGAQLINATQIMIISRWISLEAAATFSVATKFYGMAMQLVGNPVSSSAPGLTELFIRGEQGRFVKRYWDLITLTLAISILAAVGLAAGNRSLIAVWTSGTIHWTWFGDLLLGLLIILRNFNGCFVGMFGLIKDWKPVRHIYLLEGLVFVPVAIAATRFGVTGVLVASLIVHVAVTTTLSARHALKILGPWNGGGKSLSAAFTLIAFASIYAWKATPFNPIITLFGTSIFLLAALPMVWHVVLPHTMKGEVAARIDSIKTILIKRICGAA